MIDLNRTSDLYSKAASLFLNTDLSGAIATLSEDELNTELAKLEEIDDELNQSIRKNADSRILKAQLLTLDLQFIEAQQSAGRGLQLYEDLAERDPDHYMVGLASCFEDVSSIYYNTGQYDEAEACFHNGLGVCNELQEMGIHSELPLVGLLLQNIGACHYSRGEYEAAKKYLEEANTLFAGIQSVYSKFEGIDLSSFEDERAMAITNLGTTYRAIGMYDNANKLLLQGREIYEKLVAKDEDKHVPGLVKNLLSLSKHYLTIEDFNAAKDTYLRLLPIIRKLVEKDRQRYLEELADLLLDICSLYLRTEKPDEAREFCDEAIILYQEFASTIGERAEVQMAAALMYHSLLLREKEGISAEVIRAVQEAKAICEKYPDNSETKKYCDIAEILLRSSE